MRMFLTPCLAAGLVLSFGCSAAEPTPDGSASEPLSKVLSLDLCLPDQQFSMTSTNAYFPIDAGKQWLFEGEEDGVMLRLQITALDETEVVAGVTTRVLEEREWEDDELAEVSRNFFAEAPDGTVCYFGESVDIYEDGEVVSHEGAWRADAPGNQPGIIMPADPHPGMIFQMEAAPGVAEDHGAVVGIGPVEVAAGRFTETIRVKEFHPVDRWQDQKIFAAGVGLVIDGVLELVSY